MYFNVWGGLTLPMCYSEVETREHRFCWQQMNNQSDEHWSEPLKSSSSSVRLKCRSSPYPSPPVGTTDSCELVDPSAAATVLHYPQIGGQIPHTGPPPPTAPPSAYSTTPPDLRLGYPNPYDIYDDRYIRSDVTSGAQYGLCSATQIASSQPIDSHISGTSCVAPYPKSNLYEERPWSQGSGSSSASEDTRHEYTTLISHHHHNNNNSNGNNNNPPSVLPHPTHSGHSMYSIHEYYMHDKYYYSDKIQYSEKYSDKIHYNNEDQLQHYPQKTQQYCEKSNTTQFNQVSLPNEVSTSSLTSNETQRRENQSRENTDSCTQISEVENETTASNSVTCGREMYTYIESEVHSNKTQPGLPQPVHTSVIKNTQHYYSQNEFVH